MNSLKFSATHFVILFLLGLLGFASGAAPIYVSHVCTNRSNLEPNSTFQSHLNILLSSLTSNASLDDGFLQTTTGLGTPHVVHGLFLCRGDVTAAVCKECVTTAAKEIIVRCSKYTESIIWYDDCMLRYNKNSFNNRLPRIYLVANQNIADLERDLFNQLLGGLLNRLAQNAVNSPSKKKFATGEQKFTTSQTLHALAQCTPDLSTFDCNMCFRSAISSFPMCCEGKQGARALLPGCNVRYELYPFYNIIGISSTPVVPRRSGGSPISLIVALIVPIVVFVTLFVLGCRSCVRGQGRNTSDRWRMELGMIVRM